MQGPHTILSVGRDAALLTRRHAMLRRAGYAVTSAAQPAKALQLLDSHSFDLVLVGTHGKKERDRIETMQHQKNLRVIFLPMSRAEQRVPHEREILRQVAEALSTELNAPVQKNS